MSQSPSTPFHVTLADGLELRLTITAREYNHIPPDPQIHERPATLPEIKTAVATLHHDLSRLHLQSQLP